MMGFSMGLWLFFCQASHCMVVLISNSMIFDAAGPDRISPHNRFVAEVPPSDNPGLKLRA